MKKPYSVDAGYADDELSSYMYTSAADGLFVLVGEQKLSDDIYISIEGGQTVYQDVFLPKENLRSLRDYLNKLNLG